MSAKYLMFKPEELNLTSSVSRNSLRYRYAKLNNCLIETGLGRIDFSIKIKRNSLKDIQHIIL